MEATGQSTQIDLGHWLLRLVALIIDSILLGIIAWIIGTFGLIGFIATGAFGFWFFGGIWLIIWLLYGIIAVLYFFVLDVAWQGTIGKRVLGLQVQTVNGARINYSQSFIRNISKIFTPFLILDWLIGILTPGDKRQKYTDRAAGVVVVQKNQPLSSVIPPASPAPAV
jgi:uncharacterized RDD family membrane protein YckC